MSPRRSRPIAAAVETPAVPEATRDQILVEAARLFRHQGYAATTLRQIADAAGIKAGSIYYHFEGKDDIAAIYRGLTASPVLHGLLARD